MVYLDLFQTLTVCKVAAGIAGFKANKTPGIVRLCEAELRKATMAETYPDSTNLKFRELLKEVQLDYSPENTAIINDAVSAIREAIDHIPDDGVLVTADDVAPGFIRDVGADKVDFKFVKPKSVEIGGSYAFQCVARPDVNVDIFLRLPKECFHEKDYLNYRYHSKRFLYLCLIKKYLKNSSSILDVKWSAFQNEARKPILTVYPAARLSDNSVFSLKIIPTAPSLFTLSKLNMERNDIRVLDQEATPKYNSSILEDMFIEENAEFIKSTFKGRKELGEALLLLKVWARKSSLFVHDCLSGFLITIIVAYLASRSGKSRITNSMNAMQIFRITLDFIANSKLWDSGLFFQPEGERNISDKDRKTNLQSFPIIVCDSFGNYNMAFRMSPSGFQELRDEAVLALACMDKCNDMGFDEIFMTKIDYPAKYDYCIRLNLKGNHDFHDSGFCLNDECWRSYEQKVLDVIDQALKGRTKLIRVVWRNIPSDCNFENGLSMLDGVPLFIGITIGSIEDAFKQAVVGPSPEDKDKALEFRKFWGDKATLRWFRDGKIAEVAVWEHEEWEKHLIIKEICEHVLMRHLALPKQSIICTVDQLDFVLRHSNRDPISCSKSLLKAYDDLSKNLRLLDDIPLKISSVQPLDSAFRLTSVFPPAPHPLANEGSKIKLEKHTPNCIQPLEIMIQLEGSGNWPMDELAMEKTKTAFLLRIAESLQTKLGITCTATEDDVDVFMSGYAFRLKILHERGLTLVKNHGGQIKRVLSSDKKLFLRGQHSSMVNGLRGRYPIYGPVVRLAKRWVSAHLFSNSLSEEAIELLVAHLFLKPLPFRLPGSRITGFLRFLRLLSKYDWSFCPLIVDINGDLTPNDDKEIIENFMSNRKQYEENLPNVKPAMFLASSYDRESEAWTGQSPTATDLMRLAAYANSSANFLTNIITSNQNEAYGWECLFRTPLNNYNAVILLHRDKLPYPHHLLFPSEVKQGRYIVRGKPSKTFQPLLLREDTRGNLEELKSKLMVGFDPLKYFVVDIEREFSDTFKVWYDSFGGDAIGLTCGNNKSSKKRGRDDNDDGKDLVDTLKAVGELGKGFVRSVHFLKAPKSNNT